MAMAPYTLFLNETTYGNTRFLRTNVLSARPDLKKYSSIRFQQDLKRHPDALGVCLSNRNRASPKSFA